MLNLILSALYFILPAYIGNTFPVFAAKLKLPGGVPVHARLFGTHKTYRGIYSAYLGALLMLWLQLWLQSNDIGEALRLLDYSAINLFLYAFLFGVGAIAGDMVESFIKRRLGKPAGAAWFPWDQWDLVIGALVFTYPFYQLDVLRIVILLVVSPVLHMLTNIVGYHLGLKEVWW